eukprot:3983220-Pleurochrysis_carterae.AAC.1
MATAVKAIAAAVPCGVCVCAGAVVRRPVRRVGVPSQAGGRLVWRGGRQLVQEPRGHLAIRQQGKRVGRRALRLHLVRRH